MITIPTPTVRTVPSSPANSNETKSDTSSSSSSSNKTGVIVGSVIGSVAVLAFLLGALIHVRRNRKKEETLDSFIIKKLTPSVPQRPLLEAGKQYTIIQEHQAFLEDELTVRVGDLVRVAAIYDDGWVSAVLIQPASEIPQQGMIPRQTLNARVSEETSTMKRPVTT